MPRYPPPTPQKNTTQNEPWKRTPIKIPKKSMSDVPKAARRTNVGTGSAGDVDQEKFVDLI